MKYHRITLVLSLLIIACAVNSQSSVARTSPQESDYNRTRDAWQRPAEVFDSLALKPGDRVADIGCGSGYFTFRMAARVGAEGKVYAVDIDQKVIDKVTQRKEREKLEQVEPILGESSDPRLPGDLDSALIVDSYHEFRDYDLMMQAVFRALKPGARLVIIDAEAPSGRPRTEYHRYTAFRPSWCAKKSHATDLSSKKAGRDSMTLNIKRSFILSSSRSRRRDRRRLIAERQRGCACFCSSARICVSIS